MVPDGEGGSNGVNLIFGGDLQTRMNDAFNARCQNRQGSDCVSAVSSSPPTGLFRSAHHGHPESFLICLDSVMRSIMHNSIAKWRCTGTGFIVSYRNGLTKEADSSPGFSRHWGMVIAMDRRSSRGLASMEYWENTKCSPYPPGKPLSSTRSLVCECFRVDHKRRSNSHYCETSLSPGRTT